MGKKRVPISAPSSGKTTILDSAAFHEIEKKGREITGLQTVLFIAAVLIALWYMTSILFDKNFGKNLLVYYSSSEP